MAESFYKFQDTKTSPSRDFKDFEEEWLQLGEDFSIVFDSGNSPKDPDQTPEKESTKRKISETEDSLILTRRKMLKQNYNEGFTQQTSEDDPILKTFREENPEKFKVLEKRTRCKYTLDSSVSRNIHASPGSTPETPVLIDFIPPSDHTLNPQQAYSTASSGCDQVVPSYRDSSVPKYTQASPGSTPATPVLIDFIPSPDHTLTPLQAYSTASQGCNQVVPSYGDSSVPKYTQASPGSTPATPVLIDFIPSPDHTLTPLKAYSTASSGCDQPYATQYPLQEELGTLSELVDSLRVDLFQTSMLVNYIQDYIKKWK